MLNKAILMGRLVADPELRQTPNGVPVAPFRIAVERNYVKDRERQADFIDIVAWRGTAEFVSRYFRKGTMMIVEGSIQTRNYEDKNGNKRVAVEVIADHVLFGEAKNVQETQSGSTHSLPLQADGSPTGQQCTSNNMKQSGPANNTETDSGIFAPDTDSDDLPF